MGGGGEVLGGCEAAIQRSSAASQSRLHGRGDERDSRPAAPIQPFVFRPRRLSERLTLDLRQVRAPPLSLPQVHAHKRRLMKNVSHVALGQLVHILLMASALVRNSVQFGCQGWRNSPAAYLASFGYSVSQEEVEILQLSLLPLWELPTHTHTI